MKNKKISVLIMISILILGLVITSCSSSGKPGNSKSQVKLIEISLTDEEYAFGVDKNQPELLAKVNDFIQQISSDGTLDEIFDK